MGRKKKTIESQPQEQPKAYVKEKDYKDLAVEKLSDLGWNVALESGVVVGRLKSLDDFDKFKEAINSIEYTSSWGIKIVKGDMAYETFRSTESIESKGSEDYD